MAVFNLFIFEILNVAEATRKNLHTANVAEQLFLVSEPRSNYHLIAESLPLRETLSRAGGIINLAISEAIVLTETLTTLHLTFRPSETLNIQEGLTLTVIPGLQNWAGDISPPNQAATGAMIREVPAGDIDGVNDTFVLSSPVGATSALTLYVDSVLQTEYVLVGDTITFNVGFEPPEGSQLLAYYRA